MKPLNALLVVAMPAMALFAGAAPGHAADPNTGVTLQVQVTLPKTHRPNPDAQLISAFVSRIRDSFARQGYVGAIAEASPGRDVPNETAVLLSIEVTELRVDGDEVNCRFRAGVRTHAEQLDLGQFQDKGLRWNRDAADLGPRSDDENDPTMLRLYQALAASRLVPGLAGG